MDDYSSAAVSAYISPPILPGSYSTTAGSSDEAIVPAC